MEPNPNQPQQPQADLQTPAVPGQETAPVQAGASVPEAATPLEAPVFEQPVVPVAPATEAELSDKSYVKAVVLSNIFGPFGVDRFYLGYKTSGVIKLLTFGGLGIWALIDVIRLIFGSLKGQGDKKFYDTDAYQAFFKKLFWFSIIFMVVYLAVVGTIAFASSPSNNGATNTSTSGSLEDFQDSTMSQ